MRVSPSFEKANSLFAAFFEFVTLVGDPSSDAAQSESGRMMSGRDPMTPAISLASARECAAPDLALRH